MGAASMEAAPMAVVEALRISNGLQGQEPSCSEADQIHRQAQPKSLFIAHVVGRNGTQRKTLDQPDENLSDEQGYKVSGEEKV